MSSLFLVRKPRMIPPIQHPTSPRRPRSLRLRRLLGLGSAQRHNVGARIPRPISTRQNAVQTRLALREALDEIVASPPDALSQFLTVLRDHVDADSAALFAVDTSRKRFNPIASTMPSTDILCSWDTFLTDGFGGGDVSRDPVDHHPALVRSQSGSTQRPVRLRIETPSGELLAMVVLRMRSSMQFGELQHLELLYAASLLSRTLIRFCRHVLLHKAARQDGLTEIANRRTFDEALERSVAEAQRKQSPVALVLLDLDRFKSINDHYGHPAGDEVLCHTARICEIEVERQIRRNDQAIVARIGGEELAILLPGFQCEAARRVAEAVRQRLAETPFTVDGQSFYATTSIGIAVFPDNAASATELYSATDAALYQAKRDGRNRVHDQQRRAA